MSLSIATLSVIRQHRVILSDISFEVGNGKAILLRGPNGVGKTTLLRALAGFIPAMGTVLHNGADLRTAREDYLQGIALSGHLDGLKPAMTVAETLAFWSGIYGSNATRIAEAFDLVQLADRPTARLSAGQKRRLGLARLPLTGAMLWLMDEPTVSLDAENTARLVDVLKSHLAGGGKAIISTHQPLDLPGGRSLTLNAIALTSQADPFLEGIIV